jgi:hypothetical protein
LRSISKNIRINGIIFILTGMIKPLTLPSPHGERDRERGEEEKNDSTE